MGAQAPCLLGFWSLGRAGFSSIWSPNSTTASNANASSTSSTSRPDGA
jgi:hypothetical protein